MSMPGQSIGIIIYKKYYVRVYNPIDELNFVQCFIYRLKSYNFCFSTPLNQKEYKLLLSGNFAITKRYSNDYEDWCYDINFKHYDINFKHHERP